MIISITLYYNKVSNSENQIRLGSTNAKALFFVCLFYSIGHDEYCTYYISIFSFILAIHGKQWHKRHGANIQTQ